MNAIETTGSIEKPGIIKLDTPLNFEKKQKVRVIILFNEGGDIEEKLWLSSVAGNPSFSFLKDEKEDIYSINDGKPAGWYKEKTSLAKTLRRKE